MSEFESSKASPKENNENQRLRLDFARFQMEFPNHPDMKKIKGVLAKYYVELEPMHRMADRLEKTKEEAFRLQDEYMKKSDSEKKKLAPKMRKMMSRFLEYMNRVRELEEEMVEKNIDSRGMVDLRQIPLWQKMESFFPYLNQEKNIAIRKQFIAWVKEGRMLPANSDIPAIQVDMLKLAMNRTWFNTNESKQEYQQQ